MGRLGRTERNLILIAILFIAVMIGVVVAVGQGGQAEQPTYAEPSEMSATETTPENQAAYVEGYLMRVQDTPQDSAKLVSVECEPGPSPLFYCEGTIAPPGMPLYYVAVFDPRARDVTGVRHFGDAASAFTVCNETPSYCVESLTER